MRRLAPLAALLATAVAGACAPVSVTAPSAIVIPVGSTSTTVIVPLVAMLPLLVTVNA